MKKYFVKIWNFINAHKKASVIVGIIAAVLIIALLVFLIFIKPKWDYSRKIVKYVGDKGYTQSEIDEIGKIWNSGEMYLTQDGSTSVK